MDHNFYSHHQQKSKPEPNPKAGYTLFKWGANSGIALLKLLIVVSIISSTAFGQTTRTITGKVHDEIAAPIPGATITEKGKKNATVADVNGKFTIRVSPNATLVVSIIGYVSTEVSIKDETTVDVELKAQENSLNEVVVTALGIKREKKELTYSSQQVSGQTITDTKEPGVLGALDGKVAGVQITTTSGAPGASSRIVIRGNTSLTSNNEALIILDGVPINNSTVGGSGATASISRLSDIDPSTIESINVLKGSAASALYGSSAARGVVIVTTKSGAANTKPTVTLNSQYSVEDPILIKEQDKYALGDQGTTYYDGLTPATRISGVWGPLISDVAAAGKLTYNQDPAKAFFVNGNTATNTASVNGGTEKTGYFFSFSNLTQNGVVPTTKYGRNAFFAKFSNKITDNLTATFQLNYSMSTAHEIPEGNGLTAPLWTIYGAPRTFNFLPGGNYLDANGNQIIYRTGRNNPYWDLANIYNNTKNTRVIPVFSLTYNPVKWITVTERLGLDTYLEGNDYYEAPSALIPTVGIVTQSSNNFRQFNNDLIIEGRKKFKDFDVSLLLGNNILDTYSQGYSLNGNGTSILGLDNVSNGSTLTGSQSHSEIRKIGFYAQSNIEYKSLLNLSLTGRYDGSSVLSLQHDFYPYGSASLGFLFGDLLNVPAINFGKLRVSYSAVGNDSGVGAYANSTPFVQSTSFPYNGVSGFNQSGTLGNPILQNETTKESEIGLEMNFLKNRVSFEASYYHRDHSNLLTSVTLPSATGFNSTVENIGNMTNRGFEAVLNISPVKSKNFSYDISFDWSKNENKITKINGVSGLAGNGNSELIVGQPYGVLYNIGYQRAADGEILIGNNGLPLATTNNIIIGQTQGNYEAGMTNTLKYKSFTLSFFLDFKNGGQIVNGDDRYGFAYGTPLVTENRADRVVPGIVASTGLPNTKVVTAETYYQTLNVIYEAAVQDITFLKLRYASLAYNLPKSTLLRTPFKAASFTVTGRNLFIYAPHFTGSDPEVSSNGTSNGAPGYVQNSVPTSRSINFALNVAF